VPTWHVDDTTIIKTWHWIRTKHVPFDYGDITQLLLLAACIFY